MPCKGYRVFIFIASFFLVFGLIFVIVGVVIGFDMTRGVEKQLEDRYCIDSKDHPDYNTWVSYLSSYSNFDCRVTMWDTHGETLKIELEYGS